MNQIVEKIRKLQALAEGATEHEAALAASRVQELLAKHNLDIGSIELESEPGTRQEVGRAYRRIPAFANILSGACDELFDVRSYLHGSKRFGHVFVFVGLKANVEAACLTYSYLMESVESLLRGAKATRIVYGSEECLAFRIGAATRIHDIAQEQKSRTVNQIPRYGELVHIANALAERMIQDLDLKGSRGGTGGFIQFNLAYNLGYDQGSRVDLHGARTNRMLK